MLIGALLASWFVFYVEESSLELSSAPPPVSAPKAVR
jgi:hypothetical protein